MLQLRGTATYIGRPPGDASVIFWPTITKPVGMNIEVKQM